MHDGSSHRTRASSPWWTRLSLALLVVYAALVILTFRDYGITWDERIQAEYGDGIISWYTSGFRDHRALELYNLSYYGGLFDLIAQLTTRLSAMGRYETRHVVNALFGALALVSVWRLGTRMSTPAAGFLSMVLLLLTPGFYGHLFNNSKDIPFAALFTASLYYIVMAVAALPAIPRVLIAKLGIAIGLTLAVRIGGLVLFGYLLAAMILWCWMGRSAAATRSPSDRHLWKTLARAYVEVCIVAYVAMLPWWPAAQAQPVLGPAKAFWKLTQDASFGHSKVFFEGVLTPATDLPRRYLPEWIMITLPEFYFVGIAVCVIVGIRLARRAPWAEDATRTIPFVVLAAVVMLPVVYAVARRPIMYDGMRHYLFIIPPLVVLLAVGCVRWLTEPGSHALKITVLGGLLASMGITAVDMVRLHPYQYVFFNRAFGGGLAHAAQSFETDYWGLSYKEGAEWVAAHYPQGPDRRLKVASCSLPASTEYFLPADRFEYVGSKNFSLTEVPDIFLATTRWNCDQTFEGSIVHVVSRQNVPLLYVKELPHHEPPQ